MTSRGPPPDGGYPNENTAEGDNSLLLLTTGADNTAIGFDALYNNTTGIQNTAVGSFALATNTVGYNNTAVGGLPPKFDPLVMRDLV